MASRMETMQASSLLYGANAAFVEEKYEAWLADPGAVEQEWRQYFEALQATAGAPHEVAHGPIQRAFAALSSQIAPAHAADVSQERRQVAVLQLINAYR